MISDPIREIPVAAALAEKYESALVHAETKLGEVTLEIDATRIAEVCRFLKHERKYLRLSGLTALDWHPAEPRFEVVYLLHSMERRGDRLRLKCKLSGNDPEIDSVTSVWRAADWYERETFDLFGIRFRNHPELTRIMMPEGWQGHPLRKDYPKHGHKYTYVDE